MKTRLLLTILVTAFLINSCKKDDSSDLFPYEAEVIGVNSDCGVYAIKITQGLSEVESIVGPTLYNGVYIAKNLPEELEIDGQKIRLDIRMPKSNELGACTNLGPTYNWLFVIRAKKI